MQVDFKWPVLRGVEKKTPSTRIAFVLVCAFGRRGQSDKEAMLSGYW